MEIDEPVEQKTQPSSISSTESRQKGWTNVHIVCNQGHQIRNKIMLNSGSSTTLFCNKNYCKQIKTTQDPIDIHTNAGIIQVKESCQMPQIGKSYYTKDAMTNIIGLADMRKKFRITYDSDKEQHFWFILHPK